MKTKVIRATPSQGRLLMISDIHGHATGLKSLLEKVHFDQRDTLVIVGDIVEKGPENLKALRYVMELCRKKNVYALMGNVDLWRLERLLSDEVEKQRSLLSYSIKASQWWPSTFLGELCEEIGVALDSSLDTQTIFPILREHFADEISFMASRPTILEMPGRIFVHGGIPHEHLDELEGTECYPFLKWDRFLQDGLSFSQYVVVGHWPTALYSHSRPCCAPVIDRQRKIICLDGGCGIKDFGQLNLLVFPDASADTCECYSWDPLPEIVALDSQNESQSSLFIQWGDNQVEVLENDGVWADVCFHERHVRVPAHMLYEQDGLMYCDDYTDYELEIAAGETLRLVQEKPYGCLVKKNDIVGWYRGNYRK